MAENLIVVPGGEDVFRRPDITVEEWRQARPALRAIGASLLAEIYDLNVLLGAETDPRGQDTRQWMSMGLRLAIDIINRELEAGLREQGSADEEA